MGSRPLIAIPSRFSASASALRHRAEVGSHNLVSAVYAAGGEPLLVHPHAPGGHIADSDVVERIGWADGVLLPGGGDMAGQWAGQAEHPTLYDVDLEQDAFDLAVARIALAEEVPLLAVCRGTQVVNVALGGTLIQDMDTAAGVAAGTLTNHRHHRHRVAIAAGSRLSALLGAGLDASCYHHQCISTLGDGLVPVAHATEGVIEAVELPEHRGWFLGVQWHPEDTWSEDPQSLTVFAGLVRAARESSGAIAAP